MDERERSRSVGGHPLADVSARILLAEDGVDNRRLIEAYFKPTGMEIDCAEDGVQTFEMAMAAAGAGRPYDVILMDVQMPRMDGDQCTRELRAAGYDGYVIALTANAMESDRERCMDAGCNDFATKPIDRIELFDKVLLGLRSRDLASQD